MTNTPIEQPSRFTATPAEIDVWLRVHFAEDTYLRYQQAIGGRAVEEATEDIRAEAQRKCERSFSDNRVFELKGARDSADHVDPGKGAGPYPSGLIALGGAL